jgi:hypothetical protein
MAPARISIILITKGIQTHLHAHLDHSRQLSQPASDAGLISDQAQLELDQSHRAAAVLQLGKQLQHTLQPYILCVFVCSCIYVCMCVFLCVNHSQVLLLELQI